MELTQLGYGKQGQRRMEEGSYPQNRKKLSQGKVTEWTINRGLKKINESHISQDDNITGCENWPYQKFMPCC